ncbi:D-Ala-D-Ala carboxypeptidase family metallohydrolase [Desulforamulus aquiferis]|uniref:Murein endopeptidase K n=1 Tax=Desulforamulus aquiferis TaxID=1397668 RepID=A0AAW7ZCK0_9FIRM|nr:D-Ala-D-Ala carboxypeptidase family metallohydrolase [Desulforamulus aquiferis]MDO7787107.1 D-Ala-D-Ala carboxypeptidase family metallohydrolase [Desulforamulus aquiferis]
MRLGSKSTEVMELQQLLIKAGYSPGTIDGVFGSKTETAVREFQRKNTLIIDGIAGSITMAKLREVTSMQPTKAQNKQLSAHFNEMEFACKGTGLVHVKPELVNKLEKLRQLIGKPITITSGYRSPEHNARIGGAINSRHLLGQAVDIVVQGMNPVQVAKLAEQVGFRGIGIYDKDRFTHVDIGPSRRWRQ